MWWRGRDSRSPLQELCDVPSEQGKKEEKDFKCKAGDGTLQDRSGKLERLSKINMNLLSTALQKEKLIVYSAETHQTQAKQKMCIC